jgi:excisionase family DNA binding protein
MVIFGSGKGGLMAEVETAAPLLDVNEVARRLGTEPRFVRRLIAERRIEFHKLGRHVRISEAALAAFIKAGRVPAVTSARRRAA